LLSDKEETRTILTGEEIVDNKLDTIITFEEPLESADYAITIQKDSPIQHWYHKEDKIESGFRIMFEREYIGKLTWSVIL